MSGFGIKHGVLIAVLVLCAYLVPRSLGIDEASHAYDDAGCGAVRQPSHELAPGAAKAMIVCLLNSERTERGLHPLYQDALLDKASQAHSDDMVERRFFEHVAPGGVTLDQRLATAGYVPRPGGMTGENIGWGEDTLGSPASVVDEWMHSPDHKENILRPQFTQVGVGLTIGHPPRREPTDLRSATYTTDFGG